MTDSPSSILLLRLQSLGSNTNLWGGYLNVAMQMLEQASKAYQTYALTVDVTISWSNYTAGNTGACIVLKLTGTLAAPVTMTLPAYMNYLLVINAAGAAVTLKCSGGTGVSIPNSRTTMLRCDGVDYYSAMPTWRTDSITPTNTGDLLTYGDVQTLIANATTITSPGQLRNSAADTTAGWLSTKLTVTSATGELAAATVNPAGNETFNLTYVRDEGQIAMYDSVFAI